MTTHEYQIKGLVPGAKNKTTMQFLRRIQGQAKMSDGLFCLFGHDKADVSNIYLYDDNGVSRGRMPLNKYLKTFSHKIKNFQTCMWNLR